MRIGVVTLLVFLVTGIAQAGESKKQCTANAHCRSSQICFHNRCMTKTQRHTIKTNANNLIIPGAVLTAAGGVGLIVGGAIIGANTSEDDPYYDEESVGTVGGTWDWGNAVIAVTVLPICGAIAATGIVLLSVGLAKRKKMERNKLAFDIRTRHGKVTFEPTFAAGENGAVFGLSGRF